MWTYMMAASRGERASMMMSASRRRNESESPKYGYNFGRSMPYRSTARHNVLSLHSTSSTLPPGAYTPYASTSNTMPYYESHHQSGSHTAADANLPSASTSAASTVSPPPFHTYAAGAALQRLPPHNSHHHIGHATAAIDEDGTSLFSPLSPCTPLTVAADKDTHIFVYKGAKAKTTRKRLIANHVANHVGEMMRDENLSVGETRRKSSFEVSDEDDPVGLVDEVERRRRLVGVANRLARADEQGAGAGGGVNHDAGIESSGADDDSVEEDYLELESGKRMSQDQTKRTKPSTLRRTLNALRQRLTRRSRSKPPDWFLEKFSNTNNVDKIGKVTAATTTAATAASEEGASGPA
ncbi:uncharacterized protein LOC118743610, partial [Rhagoletis pomonella]|uniref:uncharacterized protein LOC118743610 n=1 Tax=Rhagoletis pomonella TaxID=28610 RepID=UPI001781865A